MQPTQTTYALQENLLNAIVQTLNDLPASRSRILLNALEQNCTAQDKERAEKAAAEQREAIKAELAEASAASKEKAQP